MLTATAITLISALVYKPGWSFDVSDHSHRFEGTVMLTVTYPARNSDREQAPDYSEDVPGGARARFPLVVGDIDDDTVLYFRVLSCLVAIETHEAREFLRVDGTLWAPFHPHRLDGMRRWAATVDSVGALDPDLTFGLA